jgi:peptidoglycan/xylan/chitin deacetylase (PgdA/CDA1 family)
MTVDVDPPFSSKYSYVIENGIIRLLNLFNEYAIKATFFVPAVVAVNFPETIEKIVEQKHEVGCHGFKHALSEATLSINKKIQTIEAATKIIESITGLRPVGFRAPFFKVDRNYWIALKRNNYVYDSSYVSSPLYGNSKFFRARPFYLPVHEIDEEYGLLEIPVSVNPFLPFPLGAGWLRIFGLTWAKIGVKMNFIFQAPVVVYVHPKDIVASEAFGLPWYYHRNTAGCITMLRMIIEYVKRDGAKFLMACELAKIFEQNLNGNM